MENLPQTIGTKEVEARVIELRGKKVILDRDVAELYGVETKRVNEAVRNNPEKFPERYCFYLKVSEKQYVVENFDCRTKSFYRIRTLHAGYNLEKSESHTNDNGYH